MLHLLIHAQFGFLLHPSIKLPSAIKDQEQLRIADVGTGTGYVDSLAAMCSQFVLAPLTKCRPLAFGSGSSPASCHKLTSMDMIFQTSNTRPRNGMGRTCRYLNSTSLSRCRRNLRGNTTWYI